MSNKNSLHFKLTNSSELYIDILLCACQVLLINVNSIVNYILNALISI